MSEVAALSASPTPLTGLVLAGGRSRRMGRDKATLPWPPGQSTTLLEYVVGKLLVLCPEIIVVGHREISVPGVRGVADALPGKGSMGGLYSGLEAAPSELCLAVACDLPFLNPSLLWAMTDLVGDEDALIPMAGGREQPLHAIYRKSCLPILKTCLERDELSLRSFLQKVKVRFLEESACRTYDPELLSFRNLNNSEDLEEAKQIWHRLAGSVQVNRED